MPGERRPPTVPAGNAWAATSDAEFGAANYEVTADTVDGTYQLTYTGEPVSMAFASITAQGTTKAYDTSEYKVRYFDDTNNNRVFDGGDYAIGDGQTAPSAVDGYFMVAMTNNAFQGAVDNGLKVGGACEWLAQQAANKNGVISVYFEIAARSLEGAQVVDGTTGASEFVYDSKAQDVDFAIDGDVLTIDDDYTVTVLQEGVGYVDINNIVNAGNYTATIHGAGAYAGEEKTIEFTVSPLDLSAADYFTADYAAGKSIAKWTTQLTSVNGTEVTVYDLKSAGVVKVEQVSYQNDNNETFGRDDEKGFVGFDAKRNNPIKGGYTFNVEPIAGNPNVVAGNNGTYTINVVDTVVTDFRYGTVAKPFNDGKIAGLPQAFDLSRGEAYNGSAIIAFDDNTMLQQGTAAGQITVDPQTAAEPGSYLVEARVNVPTNYSIGGAVRQGFDVIGGIINPASVNVLVSFHGVNFDITAPNATYTEQYTGEAVTPAITVSCEGKTLLAGDDYVVEFTNAQGEAVESMVDAGKYTVEIKLANGYMFDNGGTTIAEFGVTITPRTLYFLDVEEPVKDADGNDGILYTGSAVTPTVTGWFWGNDGLPREITLDSSWYELHGLSYKSGEFFSPVDAAVEAGQYMVNVVPTGATANYTWNSDVYTVKFDIIKTAQFHDVASDAWYADEVAQAEVLGYVRGMGNNLFFPDADMTRAQFAQVVYNMAGEPAVDENEWGTYPTKFADVDGSAWYAKAVSWANEAGIVNGTSETTFEPESSISREEIATMLYRYAGNGAEADASALDAFVDGDQVCDWAETAVAWAVENGYMQGKGANDLQPHATATRAEIAALSVRVQPEAL